MTRSFGMIATAVEITLHAKALKHALIYTDSGNDAIPARIQILPYLWNYETANDITK